MCSDIVVRAAGLGKAYRLYAQPIHRLRDLVLPGRFHSEPFWALRGVDLTLRRGETLGIIGRNGSGKSTLLQLICGILKPSEGDLKVSGRLAPMLELGAGFNPEFTGRENVYLNAAVLGLSEAEIAAQFASIEDFAGIGDFIDQPVRHYSSGMYARLAFAVCAHVGADILVLDEILSVGDAAFQQKCMRFLHGFRQRGSVLFVSHDEGAVLGLCDRAIWLDKGVVRASGPSKTVCREYLSATAQGASTAKGFQLGGRRGAPEPLVQDPRWHGQNPIEIFDFDPDAPWHGHGGARIETAAFFDLDGQPMTRAEGGEEVELRITCRAERVITRPIVGFILRNRLGQNLFGDNTYLTYKDAPPEIAAGHAFTTAFRFQLPYLPTGNYAVEAFVFEGEPDRYEALAHLEDGFFLRVNSNHISAGLVNVAMRETRLTVLATTEPADVL